MLKLSRMGRGSLAVMVAGVIAAGALVGCGDNKAKQSARTDGGDGGGICSGSFVSPISGATLTIADDINKSCSGSLHTNVSLATSADDGTNVDLYVGTTKVDSQKVSGAEVHFMNVQLPQGSDMLQAVFSASCTISETVTVNCNLPMCTITAPTLSATTVCETTPPPVGCATSLPVDLAKYDDCLPVGLPPVKTDGAPPARSAAITVLGSGVGMGPAGGVGGQRQTSGNAID